MADAKIEALVALTAPATADVLAIVDDPAGSLATKKITFENLTKRNIAVPMTLTVPEGVVAFPDVHALATGSTKITGIVLPDNASPSTLNFKGVIPEDLHATPAMAARIRFMTQTTSTDKAVRLVVGTKGFAVNENFDVTLTDETEVTAEVPNGTETGNEAEILIDLTTDWAAGDTIIGHLTRDPTDGDDSFGGDILIVGIDLMMDVVGSV